MEVLFPRHEIKPLVRTAEKKRREVYDARAALRQAERELEQHQNHVERLKAASLNRALDNDRIDGRNAQERDIQIDAIEASVESDNAEAIITAQKQVEHLQRALDLATCELEAIEDEISLTRAWLYSMTRIR